MPTGIHNNHKGQPKKPRVQVICPQCGRVREYLPGFLRQHPTIRFCSRACAGKASAIAESKVIVKCAQCGIEFTKRRDHLKASNYCGKACSDSGRRVEGAKWRDPQQIKEYMRQYVESNRAAWNKKSRDWWQAHRGQKTAQNRARRASAAIGDFTAQDWEDLKAQYEFRCLCCNKTEPIISLELDHIIPLSKGGKHTRSNVQPLCRTCNASKSDKTIDYRCTI